MRVRAAITATILTLGLSTTAQAGNGDLLSLGVGGTGVFGSKSATDFRLEYRRGEPLFWQIKPFAGIETSSRGATDIMGGVLLDLTVQPHWYITPSFAPGLYFHGDGKDLGSVIEFRSQLEASYEFTSQDRFSLAVSHTSNAGIDSHNPGTEAITAYYHFPLNRFFGDGDSDSSETTTTSSSTNSPTSGSSIGGYSTYTPPENAAPAAGSSSANNAAPFPNASPMPAAKPEPF